jgi:hypothetical protein
MQPARTLALIAIILGAIAAEASASVPLPPSGLFGTVTRGPITPVCRIGVPCDAPAPHLMLTFTRAGVAKTARTDQHGAYRIDLQAGTYTVRTNSKPFGQIPRPANVHVRSHDPDKIDFAIDTGIR